MIENQMHREDKAIAARTTCSLCGKSIVLYTGEHLWYHTDGTMYCWDMIRQNAGKKEKRKKIFQFFQKWFFWKKWIERVLKRRKPD